MSSERYMYHSFPRRRSTNDADQKGLQILELIARYGLLLTPEVREWRDAKMAPSPSETYVQVAKRCCFTELSPAELPGHAEKFGPYALEFDHQTLCDLGAVPVFYLPRMSGYEDYGVGPAIVTQLAHVQHLLSQFAELKKFAQAAAAASVAAQLGMLKATDGSIVLFADGTNLSITIPATLLQRVQAVAPGFVAPEIPDGGALIGMNAGGLRSVLNIITWGQHDTNVLVGTVKALASLIYTTERVGDPLLSHYQQREWRIIGGILHEEMRISGAPSPDHRARLLELDPDFFGRQIALPGGHNMLVDECELLATGANRRPVIELVRRIHCPSRLVETVRAMVREYSNVQVASL